MAEFFVPILVALPVFFLWLVVVALLVRPFGVQLPLAPFNFRRRSHALHALTFPQYLLVYGVLCFGCGMLIFTTISHYIEWKYWHYSTPLTGGKFLAAAVWWPIVGGLLFGLISWYGRAAKRTP